MLCVDIGNVLIEFDGSKIKTLLASRDDWQQFLNEYSQYDLGDMSLLQFFNKTKKYFKSGIFFTDFARAYADCIDKIHAPMFNELLRFKESGRGRLGCITDNNPFCFNHIALHFPEIFELFREYDWYKKIYKDLWIVSCEIRSLKSSGMPFAHAPKEFGFYKEEGCLVDDMQKNGKAWIKEGFAADSFFQYKIRSESNHKQFQKFLDKHFPAVS